MYWYTNLPDKLEKTPKRGRSMTYKGIMYLYCTLLYSVQSPPLVPSRGPHNKAAALKVAQFTHIALSTAHYRHTSRVQLLGSSNF